MTQRVERAAGPRSKGRAKSRAAPPEVKKKKASQAKGIKNLKEAMRMPEDLARRPEEKPEDMARRLQE